MAEDTTNDGKCGTHGLQTGPDGKCAICRRQEASTQDEDPGIGGRIVLGLIAAGLLSIWYFSATAEPVDHSHKGPTTEDLIAVVDEQIEELERARSQGELGPAGLQRLTQLEHKRARLEAVRKMGEENRD
jgi:hypothetical protein